MGRQVRIITDAVADVPRDVLARYRVGVLPVYLMLNGRTYLDDGTLDRDWFYHELGCVQSRPSTAAPAPAEYIAVCERLVAEGASDIVMLTAASTISSLYQHAVLAAQQFTGARVHVVDTRQISMGAGWMVIEAARLADQGESVSVILEEISSMPDRVSIYGVLDSLSYLRRSGRVGWVSSYMASLLQIRPLIVFEQGKARLMGRVRAYWRGAQSLLELVKEALPVTHLALIHSGADQKVLERFSGELYTLVPGLDIPVVNIGSAFAAHVGPRCLGVALVRSP